MSSVIIIIILIIPLGCYLTCYNVLYTLTLGKGNLYIPVGSDLSGSATCCLPKARSNEVSHTIATSTKSDVNKVAAVFLVIFSIDTGTNNGYSAVVAVCIKLKISFISNW